MLLMTDLLAVLPEFDTKPHSTLLSLLEQVAIKTGDLLCLDVLEIAKRARAQPSEVKALVNAVVHELHGSFNLNELNGNERKSSKGLPSQTIISTLDTALDDSLLGGIRCGCLTEIVGESAAGKTQFLLTLLLSVQLPPPHGLGKSALYISTEAPLQTARLQQVLSSHVVLSSLLAAEQPSMSRIHSTHIHDVESQEHILRYQVPVLIQRQNVGLLVVDSIAANYRAEFSRGKGRQSITSFAQRSHQITQLGTLLRQLAQIHQIAVVVANQVADRFDNALTPSQNWSRSQNLQQSNTMFSNPTHSNTPADPGNVESSPSQASLLSTGDPLVLDHQQRFFTGWGEDPKESNLKTPSLGLMWTNQLDTRITLHRAPIYDGPTHTPGKDRDVLGWKRYCKVIFSNWCGESVTPYVIWEGGVRSVEQV